ncbi:GAF domain-containing protein [Lysobacter sp. HA35]
MQASDREQQLSYMLENGNSRDALVLLNWQSEFRFTALFRFDGEWLRQVELYDRLNPAGTEPSDIPILASYCLFVRDTGKPVEIYDSYVDERVQAHPKRPVVRSYCSAPLVDIEGRAIGTVCHFDPDIRPITPQTVDALAMFARLIQDNPDAMAGLMASAGCA